MDFNAAIQKKVQTESRAFDKLVGFIPEKETGNAVVPVNPYDLAPVQARFNEYLVGIQSMKAEAESLTITDDKSNVLAVEMASQAKKLVNNIENVRLSIVEAPKKFTSTVDKFARVFKDQILSIETELKKKTLDFLRKKEAEHLEAERKLQEEQAKLQAKLDKAAKKAGVESVKVPDVIVPELQTKTKTEDGTAFIKKEWTYRIIDISQVPREYMILDEKKVKGAVKAGIRSIPGLEIFEDDKLSIRTR